MSEKANIELLNIDCMEYMASLEDKVFDLAIVDPPYGIKESSFRANPSKCAAKKINYNTTLWMQEKPNEEYFNELFRVSKNQIVWGGNYFSLPLSRHWIVWDKVTDDSNFADCELAWTSYNHSIKKFKFAWNGMIQGDMKNKENRIHPTQKPVALYRWLLKHYALCKICESTNGMIQGKYPIPSVECSCGAWRNGAPKILDTHLGSGSIAIAAHQMGFNLVGCEIDSDYYNAALKRYNEAIKQQVLFGFDKYVF